MDITGRLNEQPVGEIFTIDGHNRIGRPIQVLAKLIEIKGNDYIVEVNGQGKKILSGNTKVYLNY